MYNFGFTQITKRRFLKMNSHSRNTKSSDYHTKKNNSSHHKVKELRALNTPPQPLQNGNTTNYKTSDEVPKYLPRMLDLSLDGNNGYRKLYGESQYLENTRRVGQQNHLLDPFIRSTTKISKQTSTQASSTTINESHRDSRRQLTVDTNYSSETPKNDREPAMKDKMVSTTYRTETQGESYDFTLAGGSSRTQNTPNYSDVTGNAFKLTATHTTPKRQNSLEFALAKTKGYARAIDKAQTIITMGEVYLTAKERRTIFDNSKTRVFVGGDAIVIMAETKSKIKNDSATAKRAKDSVTQVGATAGAEFVGSARGVKYKITNYAELFGQARQNNSLEQGRTLALGIKPVIEIQVECKLSKKIAIEIAASAAKKIIPNGMDKSHTAARANLNIQPFSSAPEFTIGLSGSAESGSTKASSISNSNNYGLHLRYSPPHRSSFAEIAVERSKTNDSDRDIKNKQDTSVMLTLGLNF